MSNNQNANTGNRGVFPGSPVPAQGTIKTGPTVSDQNQQTQQPAQEQVQQTNLSHHNTAPVETASTDEGATTFIRLETTNAEGQLSGIIEIDLISFREKGQESRFLSINTTGADQQGNESRTTINIDNEEDFNKFKKFISELNWND